MNNEELLAKYKALFPDNVEAIVVRKDDYDRLYGDLTKENIELKQENERLNNIINNDDVYGYIKHLEDRIAKMKAYFPNDIESKEKIEKAIEYINKNEFRLFYKEQSCVNGATNLLEILKGSDKE